MDKPLQITFRGLERSDAMEAKIRERAEKLEKFYSAIISCRVVVEAPHKHHHKGQLYWIHLDISVPDDELVVNRNPVDRHSHEDAYVAIRDAFDAARRQLEDYARRRRHEVKFHSKPARNNL